MPLPLLQLVHASDIHMGAQGRGVLATLRRKLQALSAVPGLGAAVGYFTTRTMPHDPTALIFFEQALNDVRLDAPDFWPDRTQLVVTGDLSIVGAPGEIRGALTRLEGIARSVGLVVPYGQLGSQVPLIAFHGNHDVWPAGFPLWTRQAQLDAHRSQLRAAPPFNNDWPLGPLVPVAMGTHGTIELHSLTTILHDRFWNSLALGKVMHDRYWEGANLPDQLQELPHRCTRRALRIVLTHHPVHRPDLSPAVLVNAPDVATALSQACPSGSGRPLAHLVLSGHTHESFPEAGHLPGQLPAGNSRHAPLMDGQAQLTVGTLSQLGWGVRGKEHDFQVLRFWLDDSVPPKLVLEREIYRRTLRAGPYQKVAGNTSGQTSETMELLP